MYKLVSIIFLSVLALCVTAQQGGTEKTFSINKSHTVNPRNARPDFNAQLKNIEAPSPDGDSYRSFLMRQKIESRKQFPQKATAPEKKKSSTTPQPKVGQGMSVMFRTFNGNTFEYSGGIPNDNTMALSNNDILLAGFNSAIWAYHLKYDSTLFKPTNLISLQTMADGDISHRYYDPKLVYDKKEDRYILVFLKDNVPSTSAIVVCFSSTNNPLDPWHVYELPGNPLNNNRWTDFPAISLTENELFITGNLIIPGVSWQVGFDGSVIWQIDKNSGYANSTSLKAKLHQPATFNGRYTRNIHPVQNINQDGNRQYFLSNRNFDVTNDTIFVMHIDGTQNDTASHLKVGMGKTTPNYGVPPNGRQADTDTTDPTKGLQTNDARVLAAIAGEGWIQFVSNTVNPSTGYAAIYHGIISHPATENQNITGTILADPIMDLGYPNIAFTGNEACDFETIIGMNFTSPTDFPGVGAFYFGNDSSHSSLVRLKEGDGYVDKHSDSYERWGDYFGLQRKHNEPGEVWLTGFYGLSNNRNGTWVNELHSPDTAQLATQINPGGESVYCQGELTVNTSGGVPPYHYSFNGEDQGLQNIYSGYCDGDTVNFAVTDQRGCTQSGSWVAPSLPINPEQGVYPNPFSGNAIVQFQLPKDQQVSAYIYDLQGKMVAKIIDQPGTAGMNELIFQLSPLRMGEYVVRVYADDEILLVEKMIKNQ